jgi:glycogen synthase
VRLCFISSEHDPYGGLGGSVERLARLLAREHDVTLVHTYESVTPRVEPDDPPSLRQVVVDPSRLPPIPFSCDDHARSAAAMLAIEDAFGDAPPDYLEVPDYRGHGLVPLQARNAGHRSLRGCSVGVRLRGMAEIMCMHDGTWPPPEHRIVFDFEREALRLADFVVWPGGDVLGLYRRCIDSPGLDRAERLRLPVEHPGEAPKTDPVPTDGPLRILFAGRLQEVKGVLELVEGLMGSGVAEWWLTMVGADTDTAPLRQSMRATIETMCAAEPRVTILDPIPRAELQAVYGEHDLVVVPSKFEAWSNVALEAMRAGLPVLASPVGGLTELVEPGVTGWLFEGTDRFAIQRGLERVLGDRGELERVRASGEIFKRFERLTDEETVLGEYRSLLSELRRPETAEPPAPAEEPLVTGIVPYYGEHELVGEAVRSLLDQTHRNLEVVIVNDGSFDAEDRVLDDLAEDPRVRVLTKLNRGDQSARNLGIVDAEGEYVAMLDSDNALEPEFVEKAVTMLRADPDLAYVTCWLRYLGDADGDEALDATGTNGYPPLGNAVRSDEAINSDGDAIAVLPRRLFTALGYRYEERAMMADWELYRVLRDDERYGAVIPELLAHYRVRDESMSRIFFGGLHAHAWDESLSRRRARKRQWVADE